MKLVTFDEGRTGGVDGDTVVELRLRSSTWACCATASCPGKRAAARRVPTGDSLYSD